MKVFGKGKYNQREIKKVLRRNGYRVVSESKHIIFKNEDGDMISIPRNCKNSIIAYEFKHHNIS